jgi:hypothetical protein
MPSTIDVDTFGTCAELFKDTDISSEMAPPDDFKGNLQTIEERTPYILAEFKNAYVLYNKNPEYPDYQQMFENTKANIENINSKLFTFLNDVEMTTDKVNKKMLCLNDLIVEEKNKNRILKNRNGIIEEKNNAASELIFDYKKIYEEGYLRNWGLIISIVIVGFLVKNIYGNINGDLNSSVANVTNNVKNIGSNLYTSSKNIGSDLYNNAKNIGK